MNIRLAACLLVLAALAGCVLYLVAGGSGRGRGAGTPARVALEEAHAPELVELAGSAQAPGASGATAAPEVERAEVAPLDSGPAGAWRGELAGLAGRVLESDGRPVPGIRVALLEFEGSILFDGTSLDEEPPTLEREETRTDEAGRFLLGGARQQAFHALGIDLGGPRSTFRFLDLALAHGERTDVGDVVLAPFGVLTGRVLDEQGAPLAGARVRCGPFPPEILQGRPQDLRADSTVAISLEMLGGGDGRAIVELPGWVRAWIDRLPVPTTLSGADGTFRLEGVALAQIVGGIDLRGYVGVTFGPLDLTGGLHDLGDQVLARGRTVRGVVEDSSGEPVAGAEVQAGAELVPGIVAVLQSCGPTDEDGRFELAGVRDEGQIVAAARRAPHEAWSTVLSPRHDRVLIEMESLVRLTVNVRDEAGQPLAGAALRLEPLSPHEQTLAPVEVLAFLPRPPTARATFTEVEPGRHVNAALAAGRYRITARVADRAPGFLETECRGSENEVTVTCPGGRRIELTVLEAASRAPIPEARASVLHAGASGFTKLAVHRTDALGRTVLGPLSSRFDALPGTVDFPAEPMLLVEHPRYGDHSALLDPDVSPLVVELSAGGTLAGRVHCGGAQPTQPYMLILEYRGADGILGLFHLPRFAVTDLAGAFRCANLAPGEYGLELTDRFLQQDPLGLMAARFDPATIHRDEFVIRAGETTELVIDLTPTGRGATARVVGHVRFDGRNLAGANVAIRGNESLQVTTDAGGRFETAPFSVLGKTHVAIEGEVALAGGPKRHMPLYSETVELAADDVHTLELDLYPIPVRARVLSEANGAPVPGAEVSIELRREDGNGDRGAPGSANDDGEVELVVLEPGEYVLTASAEGFCRASTRVQVNAEGAAELAQLRLPHAVPCRGHVDTAAAGTGPARFSWLWVQEVEGPGSAGTQLEAPEFAFTLEGLAPAKYTAHLYVGGQRGEEVTFELGKDGTEDLVIVFTPAVEEDNED